MLKKAIVCLFVFLLMFSSAWFLNQQTKRQSYVPTGDEEHIEIIPIHDQGGVNEKFEVQKTFGPREYVRVRAS
ncbi:hypothetical protein CU633_01180 [Bacillus sp. V3-13]|uniref:hypothetical protein n=1 Tax=Bacillus sp. V3-13 TaxID=2053728 RepID=UPI000C757EA7|nr:hypothetical protein [Bacillus sp. V3-13]PLR79370.1 hypothetical protein CU633_01180 [Bacillus sp. V3-13]